MTRLAIQSRLVPGESLRERYDRALSYGFDGMELSGFPMIAMAEEAVRDGVPISAICSGHRGWFIDPDEAQIRAARDDSKRLLELGAQLDAPLIVVPIYGRTNKLPNSGTGRSPADDEALWLEGLHEIRQHAEQVGGRIVVEAINRYENSVSVTVADAVRWARAANSANVKAMGDVFHMNIEEADFGTAFESMGDMLGYVHLADSQRLEPGQGHLDWPSVFGGLARMRYDGWASMECNLSGAADDVLPVAVRFLWEQMARAEERAGVAA